jgi:N-acetylmuramic acid 6-phosphate etherase
MGEMILAVARELGAADEVIVGAAEALAAPDAARALGDALIPGTGAAEAAVRLDRARGRVRNALGGT